MTAASHQQSFVASPLLPLTAAFATGIVLAHLLHLRLAASFIAALATTVVAVWAVVSRKTRVGVIALRLALCALGVCFSLADAELVSTESLSYLLESGQVPTQRPVLVTGVVYGPVEYSPDAIHLNVRVQEVSTGGKARDCIGVIAILVPSAGQSPADLENLFLRHGTQLRIATTLERSDRFRNPGVSGLGDFLENKGYDAMAFVKSPLLIERLGDNQSLMASLYLWRFSLEKRIVSTFSRDTAAVLNAALVGNRYGLSRQTSEKFREGGTFHVLVISGLHISFLGSVIFAIARRITKKRLVQFLVSTLLLWAYAVAVGANASVVRAAFMFSFVAFAPIVGRRSASLNALSAAALLLLVFRPRELFDPSFQLTFLSVFAIVVFAWPLLSRLSEIGRWRLTRETPFPPNTDERFRMFAETLYWSEKRWLSELSRSTHKYKLFKTPVAGRLERWHLQRAFRYSFTALVVSFSVQLTLAPLLILHFHRISFAGLFLNIGISFLMVLLTIVAAVALMITAINSALASPFVHLADAINWLMVNSVTPFSHLELASLRVPEYSGKAATVYVLYFVPLLLLGFALSRWNPFLQKHGGRWFVHVLLIAQLFCIFAIIVHPFSARTPKGLRIDFLDVGQGDAALVTMRDGVTVLIDGGGRPSFGGARGSQQLFEPDKRSIGEAVVSEFVWNRGLDRVDYVLPTHADADHIDGLNDIVRNFSVRAALVGRTPVGDPDFDLFRATTESRLLPVFTISSGDTMKFDDVLIEVLWPPAAAATAPSRNNDSVVLRVVFGNRSILLTGDIEAAAELALARMTQNLDADVLKVAHHGSKSSSTDSFVRATHPRLAIISVGRKSMFGHPHPEVVQRWLESGAQVFTTGKCGTITLETDGEQLGMKTFVASPQCVSP